ncbi:hypothetical protein FRC17_007766 [Serendipita sp. 399]|nr:hypothetical protein FRC17_007766 [Serendipita sp. 399]
MITSAARLHTLGRSQSPPLPLSSSTQLPPIHRIIPTSPQHSNYPQQRPRGSTLPSYSTLPTPSFAISESRNPGPTSTSSPSSPQRKERSFTLGSKSNVPTRLSHFSGPPSNSTTSSPVSLPPIRLEEDEDDEEGYSSYNDRSGHSDGRGASHSRHDRAERQTDTPRKNSMGIGGSSGYPTLPPIKTMMLPSPPAHMLSPASAPSSPLHTSVPNPSSFRSKTNLPSNFSSDTRGSDSAPVNHLSPPSEDRFHRHQAHQASNVTKFPSPDIRSRTDPQSTSAQVRQEHYGEPNPGYPFPSSPRKTATSQPQATPKLGNMSSLLSLTAPRHLEGDRYSSSPRVEMDRYAPSSPSTRSTPWTSEEFTNTSTSLPTSDTENLHLHQSLQHSKQVGKGVHVQSLPRSHESVLAAFGDDNRNDAIRSRLTEGANWKRDPWSSGKPVDVGLTGAPKVGETAGGKKRRSRATQEQLDILNGVYARTPFPTTAERAELAARLKMTPRSVQIWFQNKRQGAKNSENRKPALISAQPALVPLSSSAGALSSSDVTLGSAYLSVQVPDLVPLSIGSTPQSPALSNMAIEPSQGHQNNGRLAKPGLEGHSPYGRDAQRRDAGGSDRDDHPLLGRARRRRMSVNDLLSQDAREEVRGSVTSSRAAGTSKTRGDHMDIV